MIFQFDEELQLKLSSIPNYNWNFIYLLGVSLSRSQCAFISTQKTLETICSDETIRSNPLLKSVFLGLYNNFPQLKSLCEVASLILCISYGRVGEEKHKDRTIVYIPYQEINKINGDIFQKSYLMAEDNTDIEFYKFIAKWYCLEKNLLNIPLKSEDIHGGGSKLYQCLSMKFCSSHSPILCFVDSDFKFPNSSQKGETARQVDSNWNRCIGMDKTHSDYCCVKTIEEVMEVENLVPSVIIQEVCSDPSFNSLNEFIKKVEMDDPELLSFFDYKEGLRISQVITNADRKEYYLKLINYIENREEILTLLDSQINGGSIIIKGSGDDCIIPKAVDHMMEKTNKFLRDYPLESLYLPKYLKQIWSNIGQLILTWTITNPFYNYGL